MLSHFLVSQLFAFLLVFCRIGSAIMLLPGFGELYVTMRTRLMLALLISLILAPTVQHLPAVPVSVTGVVSVLVAEITTGVFIGGLSRLLISTMHVAGMIIAYQSSLASALTADIAQTQGQGTSMGNLLSLSAIVLLFATDLHHLMLRGLADSYTLFLPGQFPPMADFADHSAHMMNSAFRMALQLATPHLVVGILIYLAAGVIARLMPNIQIFFLLQAPQLLISFMLLMMAFSAIMLWYMDYFKEQLAAFLSP